MGSIDRFGRAGWLLAVLVAAGPHAATAATAGSCTIVVGPSGVLKPNATLTTLSTRNAGGSAARATITATAGGTLPGTLCSIGLPLNCMQLTLTSPTSFGSAPASGGNNVTFVSAFSQVGSSSLLNLVSLVVLNGTYQFDFDLTATKTSGSFGAGTYQASQTLRCE